MTDGGPPRSNGRFVRGQSGNPQGARTRQRRELLSSAQFDLQVLRIASSQTTITVNGREQKMSLLEVNLQALAFGKPANRLASKDFLEFVRNAAISQENREYREEQKAREQARRERGY